MSTIKCTHCGKEVELSEALTKDIESTLLTSLNKKHLDDIAKVRQEAATEAQKDIEAAKERAAELAEKRLKTKIEEMQEDSSEDKKEMQELRDQLKEVMQQLRESNKAKENAEIEMQKKLNEESAKIKADALKDADEKNRLNLAARDKTISDLQKSLADAQRKAAQGSQQLQGEIMELDLEEAIGNAFRDDDIEPIAKGVKGGDIRQIVKSPRGIKCGVMLWELKRTKTWTDGWLTKLKQDMRNEKANIPIIVSEVMPKQIDGDIGTIDGVWICKPPLAIILGSLLRKGLLDVGREKAITEHKGTKAEALYTLVTSHEFVQQIEVMVETYQEINIQIIRERASAEKLWSLREAQAQKLLLGTAKIVGSIEGQLGQGAMPKIKGLDLLESGEV